MIQTQSVSAPPRALRRFVAIWFVCELLTRDAVAFCSGTLCDATCVPSTGCRVICEHSLDPTCNTACAEVVCTLAIDGDGTRTPSRLVPSCQYLCEAPSCVCSGNSSAVVPVCETVCSPPITMLSCCDSDAPSLCDD